MENPNKNNYHSSIRKKIENNLILDALLQLKGCTQINSLRNEILILQNRHYTLEEKNRKGIIKYEDYTIEKNKIINSFLNLVNLDERYIKSKKRDDINQKKNTKKEKLKNKKNRRELQLKQITSGAKFFKKLKGAEFIEFENDKVKNTKQLVTFSLFLSKINEIRSSENNQTSIITHKKSLDNIIKELNNSGFFIFCDTSIDNKKLISELKAIDLTLDSMSSLLNSVGVTNKIRNLKNNFFLKPIVRKVENTLSEISDEPVKTILFSLIMLHNMSPAKIYLIHKDNPSIIRKRGRYFSY